MHCGLYLYGIFPPPGPVELADSGLDREPLQVATVGEFAFLYSHAQQERYLASRRNLVTHTRALERAMESGHRALLPLQFGLVVSDWDAVERDLLAPQGATLQQLLLKLAGKREVSLKIYWHADAELQALLAENPDLKSRRDALSGRVLSMEETIAIGQEIERRLEWRQRAIAARFAEGLEPRAIETRTNEPLSATMICNTAYLIPWDAEPEFAAAVEALDTEFESRLTVRYNNFTPPYHFTQLD